MDAELGDLEARMAVCTSLSANQPIYLNLYIPYPPSFIGFIRPHVHRIHSVVVHMPMDLKMDEAVDQVSKMVRSLHLSHLSFRFLRGGQDVFYSPVNMDEILPKGSRNQPFSSPICPTNMITALTLSARDYWHQLPQFDLHTLLTRLALNVHLVHLEIQADRLIKGKETELPVILLPFLRTLIIGIPNISSERGSFFRYRSDFGPDDEITEVIFLRHIKSPNPIAMTLSGYFTSLIAAICEIGVGVRPSAMTLFVGKGDPRPLDVKSEKIKRALSSVRYLHIVPLETPTEMIQTNQLIQCLPRSAILRIASNPSNDQLVSLVNHPPHFIQLEYTSYNMVSLLDLPSIPAWCRNTHRFDALLLEEYEIGSIASFCKKLVLVGNYTAQEFIYFKSNLHIEELKCEGDVYVHLFPPKLGELDKLTNLTCTLSFAVVLLQQRRLPILRRLILINSPAGSRPIYGTFSDKWESFSSLLTKTSPTRAPMQLLSIPVWTPWVPLINIAALLSQGNKSGIIPTLVLPSFPHPRILGPLVDCLNAELVTQMDDLPLWKSQENCDIEDICYECHNGGWVCADLKGCRRGRKGEPVSITRYTVSN